MVTTSEEHRLRVSPAEVHAVVSDPAAVASLSPRCDGMPETLAGLALLVERRAER